MRPAQQMHQQPLYPGAPSAPVQTMARNGGYSLSAAYPSLSDFMGLELSEEMIRLNMPEYIEGYNAPGTVARPQPNSSIITLLNYFKLLIIDCQKV